MVEDRKETHPSERLSFLSWRSSVCLLATKGEHAFNETTTKQTNNDSDLIRLKEEGGTRREKKKRKERENNESLCGIIVLRKPSTPRFCWGIAVFVFSQRGGEKNQQSPRLHSMGIIVRIRGFLNQTMQLKNTIKRRSTSHRSCCCIQAVVAVVVGIAPNGLQS
jgi:hypothetical protein